MVKKKKKNNVGGQAVLEFLTTYGYAFLVVLVLVAGLTYFGVLDFDVFTSTEEEQHLRMIGGFETSYECVEWGEINRDNIRYYCGVGCIPSIDDFDVLNLQEDNSSVDYECTRWLVFKDRPASERNSAPEFLEQE